MAKIKIAYSGTAWGRDNLVQFLDEITAVGFSGIELPGEVAAFQYDKLYLFRQMLAERVLRLESMQGHFLLDDPAKQDDEISFNKMVAEFLASCGADALILSGGLKSPEASGEYGIGRLADACNEIGSYARLLGVKACYRPCPGTAAEKEEEIARLLELTEPALVHLCPDTGHLTRAGIDPVAILRRFASRIAFVHFKDVNAGEDADKFPYCEPGRGRVDFPAILEVLREIDYEGWATVELEKCRTSPKESAGIARRYFEETLGLSLSIIGSVLRAPEPVLPPQMPEPAAAVEAPPAAPPAEEFAPPPAARLSFSLRCSSASWRAPTAGRNGRWSRVGPSRVQTPKGTTAAGFPSGK
jgi:inosose dehydratase